MKWLSFIFLIILFPTEAFAHLGSPWHSNGIGAALGFNTTYLEVPVGAESAKFRVIYPTQENTYDYRVGNTTSVIVFSNEELEKRGFITEESAVLAVENGPYDPRNPGSYEFSIKKSGYYHILFGPGPNTSILVIQSARTVNVEPVSEGAKVGQWLAPATSGDFHIVKHPTLGLKQFAGWYSVFYKEFTDVYRAAKLPTADDMDLVGPRAKAFADALVARGYPQFASYVPGDGIATSPFLGNINGLNAQAFDTAFLMPGNYSFKYKPMAVKSTIIQTNEIVLEVFPDETFAKQYGLDKDVMAKQSFVANKDEYELNFKVEKAGYYHLGYGVGEGGFLFQMTPDEAIPTNITTKDGDVRSYTRLTGIDSMIVSERPFQGGEWSVFFPCKLVRTKNHGAPFLAGVSVPFTMETRLAVARFGSAAMLKLETDSLKAQIEEQRLQLKSLGAPLK
ncbi:hypothetical protein [Phyllobacterium pellucidum]|uniref:hypothetical protein n=1 Tax=Phyllobacterium pellucidum TaxID=2740464 RepID=UPI001D14B85E|nr:hypothetical protein [Phyllobacterium sp. T1018]UGY10190.1 hypothetical protein LLE51_003130 [Phyllobacterium sp. T1018]